MNKDEIVGWLYGIYIYGTIGGLFLAFCWLMMWIML